MQVFDAKATRDALPFERLIPALHEMFAAGCEVPPRHVHRIDALCGGEADAVTSLIMPAWQVGRAYGVKIVNVAPGNAARGLPALHASYVLHDAQTGEPLALIDGDQITMRRTAAASALAAASLAAPQAKTLLVVGAGRVARLLPEAYRVVRPSIEHVTVWARVPERAQALADEWRANGFDARPAADLQTAVGEADIVSCATLATEPVVMGRWLRAGSHLDLIGSFTPTMREADDDSFRGARLYIDTDEALAKSGDLIGPLARGVIRADDVAGTLATLARGESIVRTAPDERTVFKSVGTALEDLAAAMLVWDGR